MKVFIFTMGLLLGGAVFAQEQEGFIPHRTCRAEWVRDHPQGCGPLGERSGYRILESNGNEFSFVCFKHDVAQALKQCSFYSEQ